MALSEGDKIRNFLSVKLCVSTRKDTLYPAFKDFASKQIDPTGDPKPLLEDLRAYASDFKRILTATRDIYNMRRQMRGILFERLECGHSRETKHIYDQLDKPNGCSIEHVMPQNLTPAWRETLGPDAEDIHRDWLHRLANLTLTAYNSKLSNRSFREKRDGKDGYRDSRFYLNAWIAQQETWGLAELKARAAQITERVLEIWPMPESDFVPAEKQEEAFSLEDDPGLFTSRAICRFQFRGETVPVTTWAALFGEVALILYRQDARPLRLLLQDSTSETSLKRTFSASGTDLRTPKQLTENLFLENNSSTEYKLLRLRELLDLYHADRDDLTFYLRPANARDPNDREAFLPNLQDK